MTLACAAPAPVPALSSRLKKFGLTLAATAGLLLGSLGIIGWQRSDLVAPAASRLLVDRNGSFIGQLGAQEAGTYGFWPLEVLPTRVAAATLALEDRRFENHLGVDPIAIARAAWTNWHETGRYSGASTIAMQVARMQDPQPRTLQNKLLEAATATALTLRHGREALLLHYLRIVPYGNGSHGIAHAARWYLDKPVEDLSWAEIAFLSALPQAPTLMNPAQENGRRRALTRARRILDHLADQGVMSPAEHKLANQQLNALKLPRPGRRPDALHALLHYEELAQGTPVGVRPVATLDLGLQAEIDTIAYRHLAELKAAGADQVAVMVTERATGKVRVALGSSGYFGASGGAIDFTRTPRSPGSSLKPFFYAQALERGIIAPDSILIDMPEGASGISNGDGRFLGPLLPRQALANSRNIPATQLLRAIGIEEGYQFLGRLGVHDYALPSDHFGLSMAIGSLPTTLEQLMRAYGALANDGMLKDLVWFEDQPPTTGTPVMSATAARQVTAMLSDPQARLPGFPRGGPTDYPFTVALKTGTSQGYRDAWTLAYSRDYLVGVWLGRADALPMDRLTSLRSAARLAQAVMLKLTPSERKEREDGGFLAPVGYELVELCALTGERATGACAPTLQEYLPQGGPSAAPAIGGMGLSGEVASIRIITPEPDMQIWRNPELPLDHSSLALRAQVGPDQPQVVWYVDGEPFQIAPGDKSIRWPLKPGTHKFQARLPLRPEVSGIVTVTVH